MAKLTAIVMAAGHGTRMKSDLPKVLHEAAGRPLVYYPVQAALAARAERVVVVVNPATHGAIASALAECFPEAPIETVVQEVPRGTGDAARVGMAAVRTERALILSGDTPLLRESELQSLIGAASAGCQLSFMTCLVDDPTGYGRVLRDETGVVQEIREHKDLRSDAERSVREINAGVYCGRTDALKAALGELSPDNAQGEYYLTDVVAILSTSGTVNGVVSDPASLVGVNDRAQLADAERALHRRIRESWARAGVTVRGTPLIDETVVLEPDAVIEDGVRLRGRTRISARATVDVGTVVTDASVGPDAMVKPYCVISDSSVGAGAQIGPFAHLRPGSEIENEAHIGNFVETKKTRVRRGAKANHLAYLGDGDVGEGANLGAGTIFCNYDGFRKHRTTIGRGVFVGSDSQLIAPITLGDGAYVATGTTVTEDVPPDGFAIGRARQTTKPNYASGLKARLSAEAERAKKSRG